ncbi:MAG: ribose-phosphate diphosphokinase [Candidatus Verstraetearchaeota archaeon]|nr:ribose-phosphate diphosphokinase [Candidatus Verstraetearchaeota archaeon]
MKQEMLILAGPASPRTAEHLAELTGAQLVKVEYKRFPDGESYIRLPVSVEGEEVVVVQTTYPEQDKRLVELLLMIETAKDLGAKSVTTVAPYLAYARQDRQFRDGEALSVKTVLRLIEAAGATKFVTVDIHKKESLSWLSIEGINVTAVELLSEHLKKQKLSNPVVIAPDVGAKWRAEKAAEILRGETVVLEKHRDRITGEIVTKGVEVDLRGRDVVIIDDLISTGGTIANAAKIAKKKGAGKVYVACTHALLIGAAMEKMVKAGVDEVIATDTVPSPVSVVGVAPAIAKVL